MNILDFYLSLFFFFIVNLNILFSNFFLIYWSVLNIIIYVITSEKMPRLLVNIILPFIFIGGILINELTERF